MRPLPVCCLPLSSSFVGLHSCSYELLFSPPPTFYFCPPFPSPLFLPPSSRSSGPAIRLRQKQDHVWLMTCWTSSEPSIHVRNLLTRATIYYIGCFPLCSDVCRWTVGTCTDDVTFTTGPVCIAAICVFHDTLGVYFSPSLLLLLPSPLSPHSPSHSSLPLSFSSLSLSSLFPLPPRWALPLHLSSRTPTPEHIMCICNVTTSTL